MRSPERHNTEQRVQAAAPDHVLPPPLGDEAPVVDGEEEREYHYRGLAPDTECPDNAKGGQQRRWPGRSSRKGGEDDGLAHPDGTGEQQKVFAADSVLQAGQRL